MEWTLRFEHRELGRSEIAGVEVEGIEAKREGIETVRLCVEVETNWPVRLESEGQMREAGQMLPVRTVMDRFLRHEKIETNRLDPNVPEDYSLSPRR